MDLEVALDQYCSTNVFGRATIQRVQENRALELAKELKLTVTLKRIPPVASIEHADDARFSLFIKTLWQPIYEESNGYTLIFVPSYFDYVRLKNHIKGKNQQVAMVCEYTEKREC